MFLVSLAGGVGGISHCQNVGVRCGVGVDGVYGGCRHAMVNPLEEA